MTMKEAGIKQIYTKRTDKAFVFKVEYEDGTIIEIKRECSIIKNLEKERLGK